MADMKDSRFRAIHGGPRFECTNPRCSRNGPSNGYSGGYGGDNWLYKSCAGSGCSAQIRYKEHWEHQPNYCESCKLQFRAGSLQRRSDGGWNEYHGRGRHRPDGGIEFGDSRGKHSHHVRDQNFKDTGGREEGFNKPWVRKQD